MGKMTRVAEEVAGSLSEETAAAMLESIETRGENDIASRRQVAELFGEADSP